MALGQLVQGRWISQAQLVEQGGRYEKSRSLFIGNLDHLIKGSGERAEEIERLLSHCQLIVSLGCPWAHRVLLAQRFGMFGGSLEVMVVPPELGEEGWALPEAQSPVKGGAPFVHSLYTASFSEYTGRVTLPLLWDRETHTILSNDSAELMSLIGGAALKPSPLSEEVERWNSWLQSNLNIGPYRAGFAGSQALYEEAVLALFETLDIIEAHLATRSYMCGEQLTESDLRLLPTLVRFDVAYYHHFKCNLKPLSAYPAISAYLARLCAKPEVRETISIEHIKRHYFRSVPRNDHLPIGPQLSFL